MCYFLALRGEAILASYYPVDSSSQNEYGARIVVAEKCWSLEELALRSYIDSASTQY